MANDILYINTGEKQNASFDFTDDLTGDTTLANIASGSTITATKYDGTDASSTIISSATRTGMTLSADISAVTEGEEYRVTFLGKGSTTNRIIQKVLEVRARQKIQGGF